MGAGVARLSVEAAGLNTGAHLYPAAPVSNSEYALIFNLAASASKLRILAPIYIF